MKRVVIIMVSACMCLFACKEPVKKEIPAKEFHSKTFDWSITIPENFKRVSDEEWARLKNNGRAALEKTIDGEVDDQTKRIFVFRSDKMHYMEASFQAFDTAADGNFLESCTMLNEVLYETFVTQMPDSKVDTLSGTETIDGLVFQLYNINISLPRTDKKVHLKMYSRLFDKKALALCVSYIDEDKGSKMLAAWRGSTFGKR